MRQKRRRILYKLNLNTYSEGKLHINCLAYSFVLTIMSFFNRKSPPENDEEKERFVDMVRLNAGIINKICYFYAEDTDDYNDLRQDILVNLWDSRHSFRALSSISTWVYRVALNTAISSFRQRKRRGVKVPVDALIELRSDDSSIQEQYRELHRLIMLLGHRERAVLLMWLDGSDYNTISEATGITRNTVATLLRRAKEKLNNLANS